VCVREIHQSINQTINQSIRFVHHEKKHTYLMRKSRMFWVGRYTNREFFSRLHEFFKMDILSCEGTFISTITARNKSEFEIHISSE
jgi:hypothetical protein